MELIVDPFFLGNKRMKVGSFSKIKTCSWAYGTDTLNRLKSRVQQKGNIHLEYKQEKSEAVE